MSLLAGEQSLAVNKTNDSASEKSLIEKCRQQDFEAFGKLVDAYQGRVYGYVRRRLRNDEEALDVTQEVFIKAYQSMKSFDGRASLRSWLFKIAHNLCIDTIRKHKRQPNTTSIDYAGEMEEPMEFADLSWNPEGVTVNEELLQVVDDAIKSMSDKLRTVLILHDKEDMGYEEISLTIDIPVGTVKSRLFLARTHIQNSVRTYLNTGETY